MPKPDKLLGSKHAALEITLTRIDPDTGACTFNVTRTVLGQREHRGRNLTGSEVSALQRLFMEDMKACGADVPALVNEICLKEYARDNHMSIDRAVRQLMGADA